MRMTWQEMQAEFSKAKTISSRGRRYAVLARLLEEAGINPASIRSQGDLMNKIEAAIRLRCSEEKGIKPGTRVKNFHSTAEVNKVNEYGYVWLVGCKRAYSPMVLQVD